MPQNIPVGLSIITLYEREKANNTCTSQRLRQELSTFREDAATFSKMRAMFTARTEDQHA